MLDESFQDCMIDSQRRLGKCMRLQGDYFKAGEL